MVPRVTPRQLGSRDYHLVAYVDSIHTVGSARCVCLRKAVANRMTEDATRLSVKAMPGEFCISSSLITSPLVPILWGADS